MECLVLVLHLGVTAQGQNHSFLPHCCFAGPRIHFLPQNLKWLLWLLPLHLYSSPQEGKLTEEGHPSFHFLAIGQNLVTWAPFLAREAGRYTLGGWPGTQQKSHIYRNKEQMFSL